MKIIILLFLFTYLGGGICSSKTVYVSSSLGNDSYSGLSIEKPVKTIALALTKGDTILLKANDVFYSKGIVLKKKFLSRYNKGKNPVICGYKRIIKPKWVMMGRNIWRINLAEDNYTGVNLGGSSRSNNIGCLHEYDKDIIHGRKVQHKSELKDNWDIWQTDRFDKDTPAEEFDKLYLYFEDNPNKLKLEFSITDIAISMENASIDGVDFKGYGFGISAKSNTLIRNVGIDAIGGRIQMGAKGFTCYGNGIEFWLGVQDCLVEKCIISRCYDSGCTIQGMSAPAENIRFINNIIVDCCQGWEDYISNEDQNVVFTNCVFENNLVLNSGKTTGFGYTKGRFKYCHVLGNNYKGNKGMIMRNNTFVGGNFYCSGAYKGEYKSNIWKGNICYIKRGDFILSNCEGTKDVIRIPKEKGRFSSLNAATNDAIRKYRELTGDQTTKFVIMTDNKLERKINKLKKQNQR